MFLLVDPGAEPAGHKNSRAPVSGSVCQHCGGTHFQPGQCVNGALEHLTATTTRTWRLIRFVELTIEIGSIKTKSSTFCPGLEFPHKARCCNV